MITEQSPSREHLSNVGPSVVSCDIVGIVVGGADGSLFSLGELEITCVGRSNIFI